MRRSPLGTATCAALVAMAVALGVFGHFGFKVVGPLTQFPGTFTETPLYWWPETSFFTVFCFLGLLIAGCGSQWVVDHFNPARAWATALVALGAAATVTSFYLDSLGGAALYPDRIQTREAAPGAPLRQHLLADVTRVEVGCTYDRRRTRPIYALVFRDGEKIYLENGLTTAPRSTPWVIAVSTIDERLQANQVPRHISRNVMGDPNNSYGCVRDFADRFAPDYQEQVRRLMAPAGR